jgi:four helix bundle protein
MNYVNSFKDPEVYKVSRTLSAEIFQLSHDFPKEEKYSLTDQVRRSSRSVGAQIAEAWGKRKYVNHFISKLSDADSEQLETQHWLEVASECHYINETDKFRILNYCVSIGRMLQSMMDKSSMFCKPR